MRPHTRRAWTAQETEILRHLYPRDPQKAIKALAPHTKKAVQQKAKRLRLTNSPRWTSRENAILLREWGDVTNYRTLKAKLPGRSWTAIRTRAIGVLRLGPAAGGRLSVKEAARRAGYDGLTFARILEAQGCTVQRVYGDKPTRKPRSPRRVVDWDAARRAVERHLEAERERSERKDWKRHLTTRAA